MVPDSVLQLLHFGGHTLTAAATGVLAYWVVVHTDLSSKRWFGLWMGNFTVWSVVSAALVVVTHQPTAYVLFVLWAFVGLSAIYFTFLFPTAYSGRNPATNRVCQLATVIYSLLALVILTGPLHGLYWRSVTFLADPFPHFAVEYGPGWLAAVVFSFGALGTLVYYFAELYFRSRRQQRRVVVALTLGGILGVVPVALSQGDVLLLPTYEYHAFSGSTHGLAVGYATPRFGTGTLSAVAREEALDYLVDPYIALDTRFRIVDFNTESGRLIDSLTADRVGDHLEAVAPDLAETLLTPTGVAAPDEPMTLVVGGSRRHYSVAVSTISDWNATRGYAIVLNDVTELQTSRHRIQQQNEQLDAFVGTVSHDLRSPLSVIAGRVQLAQAECDSEHLDHIEEARGRMAALIEDLLTLAREGQTVGDREPVAVAELAETCWQTVDTKEATLRTETDRTILADRSRLRQLLENLIRNAVDHGRADATISVGALETGLYVEDDGPGIPAADRQAVFDTGYSTSDDGTGFGLAIVAQIAEAHGWEVEVTEGSDGGARFEITGVDPADIDPESEADPGSIPQ